MSDAVLSQPATPECNKLMQVSEDSNKIGEFFDWLQYEHNYILAYLDNRHDNLVPAPETITTLLAEYFDIDLAKVEAERLALLEWLRKQQE